MKELSSTYFSTSGNLAVLIALLSLFVISPPALSQKQDDSAQKEWRMAGFSILYKDLCAVCHGENLQGSAQGPALVGTSLKQGESLADIKGSIALGFPDKGMPAWSKTLSNDQLNNLALYISEQRAGFTYLDFNVDKTFEIPKNLVTTEKHSFYFQTVIDKLDPLPFSIAPLPDGRILLVEKMRGLSIISKDGKQSALIKSTPTVYKDTSAPDVGLLYGVGWMMDVAIDPDYEKNGWVYLQYGDRCRDCNDISRKTGLPVSMNKLVRGRISNGRWVDEQTIWQSDRKFYGTIADAAAGGRIAFDDSGHVFISIGLKGNDNYNGIQDLQYPWGKIHRVHNDGSLPNDNPFVKHTNALKSIWTYGHRNPQGLEFNLATGQLWSTEMGPRGGDEVNLLVAGKNYGWPLYSRGVNYDGTAVNYGKQLGIQFDLDDIEQPIVDLTPSPAISSFVFYQGPAFPGWQGNMIVGSLKAATLYRFEFKNNVLIHSEILVRDLARIRDIELGPDGEIYLLLEHSSGGKLIRMTANR